jgi:hypothetical protein
MTDERIAELMGWRWPTSAHPDDMLAKVQAVVREAVRTDAFADRCKLATDCLPQSPYRVMLENLHREMLGIKQRVEL